MQLSIPRIPGQIQHQHPVYLINVLNKECPFHLDSIRLVEALVAVLKINLKESGCGPEMINRGEFRLRIATQTSIDFTQIWDQCFYSGQGVAMSMIFRETARGSSCPRCTTVHNT
ncbi:hypothetical protein BJX70DRAFT_353801 [Aspergillus crustosus]